MIALGALSFAGRWGSSLDASETHPGDFATASGRRLRVPFVHGEPRLAEIERDDRFVAVDLPFQGGRFRLVALATRGGPGEASDVANHLDGLDGRGLGARPVAGDLLRFEAMARMSVLPTLGAMGLDGAEPLTGVSKDKPVLSKVLQAVSLSVDEEGAKVAVATAEGLRVTAGIEFRDVTFDKPFAFAGRAAPADRA